MFFYCNIFHFMFPWSQRQQELTESDLILRHWQIKVGLCSGEDGLWCVTHLLPCQTVIIRQCVSMSNEPQHETVERKMLRLPSPWHSLSGGGRTLLGVLAVELSPRAPPLSHLSPGGSPMKAWSLNGALLLAPTYTSPTVAGTQLCVVFLKGFTMKAGSRPPLCVIAPRNFLM